jgi:FlaA1/EpsC-like NDP-sugar epimerase
MLNRARLTANLHSFYDFKGKVVLCVGAGGGQLLDQILGTAEAVLIDRDRQSLAGMNTCKSTDQKESPVRTVLSDFKDVNIPRGCRLFRLLPS